MFCIRENAPAYMKRQEVKSVLRLQKKLHDLINCPR